VTDDELIGYLRENFERIEKKMDRMLKREGVDGLRDDLTLRIQMLQSEITGERMRALSDRMSDSARLSAPRIEKIERDTARLKTDIAAMQDRMAAIERRLEAIEDRAGDAARGFGTPD
jgi:hypothetical protein